MPRALKITHCYKTNKTIKSTMNIVNSLLCSSVTLLMLIQKDESSYCKFLALVKTQDVRASIVLNIE